MREIHKDLCVSKPKCEVKLVWFPKVNPKHAFICGLAIENRLTTRYKMVKWSYNLITYKGINCVFCLVEFGLLIFQLPFL